MREIDTKEIGNAIKEMFIEANYELSPDMENAMKSAKNAETSELGKQVLSTLEENLVTAKNDKIPICQDTGMAVVFLEIGQEVALTGDYLEDAVNKGVKEAYTEGYLRKSVVSDPILRENTKDNTPAIIHTKIVKGDKIKITVEPKGFGSENMSKLFMLKPADGIEGVKVKILETVQAAGPNACPPL